LFEETAPQRKVYRKARQLSLSQASSV